MSYKDPHLDIAPTIWAQGPEERRWWRLLDALPENLRQVTCWKGSTALPTQATVDGQMHANPTTVACLAGVVRVRSTSATCTLMPGDLLLIAPGVWHVHEPLRGGSIAFGQGFLAAWSDVVLGDRTHTWTGRVPSQPSRQLADAALAAADPLRSRHLLLKLLAQVLAESVAHQAFTHPALRAMLARMWSSLHRGVTVEDLVRASGLSRAQAYRVFVAGYGVPPKEALATARLWLAAELLAAGTSIGDIAERCGFPSAANFARAWKREHGTAPSKMHD